MCAAVCALPARSANLDIPLSVVLLPSGAAYVEQTSPRDALALRPWNRHLIECRSVAATELAYSQSMRAARSAALPPGSYPGAGLQCEQASSWGERESPPGAGRLMGQGGALWWAIRAARGAARTRRHRQCGA